MIQSDAAAPFFFLGHGDRDSDALQRLLSEAAIGARLDGIATAPPEATLQEAHEPAAG